MQTTLKYIAFIIIAIIGAIYVGVGSASDQTTTLMILLGGAMFMVCLSLGKRVWLLLPLMMTMHLSLRIPGRPSTAELAQVLLVAFLGLQLITSRIPKKFTFTSLEWITVVLVLCVTQVYLRHPVGISLFGSGNVGGKPYLLFILGTLTMLILSSIRVPYQELWKGLKLVIIGGIVNVVLGVLGYLLPSIGQWYGVGTVKAEYSMEVEMGHRAGRLEFLKHFAPGLANWISAFISPLKGCFSVIYGPLILISIVAAGMSGYRNVLVSTGLTYIFAVMYRGGFRSLVISLLGGVMVLGSLTVINSYKPLPPNIQRAFSWLPGSWDQDIIDDAKNSSEWRFEMWEEVIFTDNWIKNKYLGDGLGFTADELAYHKELTVQGHGMGASGFDLHREIILVTGDYHSGPISAIRTIGYLGLLVLTLGIVTLSYRAHKLIMRYRKSRYLPVVMIFSLQYVWMPIFFLFVFGDFQLDSVKFLLGVGIVRLLENSLPKHEGGPMEENSNINI